jgi:hypothetical protein
MRELTPSNDIQYQHDEPDDATAGASLPRLRRLHGHGRSLGEREEGELKESGNDNVEHGDGGFSLDLLAVVRDDESEEVWVSAAWFWLPACLGGGAVVWRGTD